MLRTGLAEVASAAEFGRGKPFDDAHGSTADGAAPEWMGRIGGWRCGCGCALQ